MRVTYQTESGTGMLVLSPADLASLAGGVVTITGQVPERARTAWSMHLGNFVTRGGDVRWSASA